MFFRPLCVTLIFAFVALGTPVKRDAAKVEADIQGLVSQAHELDATIDKLPTSGGTLLQVWAIHTDAVEFSKLLETATNDVIVSSMFTDPEVDTMLALIGSLTFEKVLNDLVAKKAAISDNHATTFAESDLGNIKVNTEALFDACLAKTPADRQSSVQVLYNNIINTLNVAIRAFSTK